MTAPRPGEPARRRASIPGPESKPALPADFVVPARSWTTEQLSLTAVPAETEWPDDLLNTYLTAPEYLGPIADALGVSVDPRWWIWAILREHSREDLVCALAALNHAAGRPDIATHYQEQFLTSFRPEIARIIQAAIDGELDGKPRVFLARHCVLRALRTVLVPDDNLPAVPESLAGHVRGMDLTISAVLLVHFIGAELHSTRAAGEPIFGGLPESLAMEMSANGLFNEAEDPGTLIARTWLLWHDYDPDLVKPTPRVAPVEMLKDAVGIELDDLLALGFAYHGYASNRQVDSPIRMKPFVGHPIDRDTVEQFLSRFALTLDELSSQLKVCPQRWQMMPIQDRPIVRIGDDIVVLDEQYLIGRVTRGLYWLVHDYERDNHGDGARQRWTQTYGKMIELRVESQIRRLAPPLLGGGSTYFTEEDLQAAFSTGKSVDKAVDAGIDFGEATVLAEIVSAQVTVAAREKADVNAFKQDIERMVLKKVRQLDVTAKNLLCNPQPEQSPLPAPARQIYPVVVRGGAFPINPATRRYVDEYLEQKAFLGRADARIQALALVDLEELELCEALTNAHGTDLPTILAGWQSSQYRAMSMRSYLAREHHAADVGRPAEIQAALGRAFTVLAERLGTSWPPSTTKIPSSNPSG